MLQFFLNIFFSLLKFFLSRQKKKQKTRGQLVNVRQTSDPMNTVKRNSGNYFFLDYFLWMGRTIVSAERDEHK